MRLTSNEVPPHTCGHLSTTMSGISSPKLNFILNFHGIGSIGNKDQLVLRVHLLTLLRHNKSYAVTAREEKQLEDLVHSMILKHRSLEPYILSVEIHFA